MFYGDKPDGERPPLPIIPELEDLDTWRVVWGQCDIEANHSHIVDNLLDVSHVYYVHPDMFGDQQNPEVNVSFFRYICS